MATMNKRPQPVPPPQVHKIRPGLSLVAPLSRCGTGPGLIIAVPEIASGLSIQNGIPSPLMKWAEESYCVVEITPSAWGDDVEPLSLALAELRGCDKLKSQSQPGLICYDTLQWPKLAACRDVGSLAAAIVYAAANTLGDLPMCNVPMLVHLAGKGTTRPDQTETRKYYHYAEQQSPQFATPSVEEFHYAGEAVAHSRNLMFLKPRMGAPRFDLEALWEEHTYYEFEARSVEDTMNTMVEEPYVNHIPTITGGIGRKDLTNFYRDHFIFSNPQDAQLELISRTTGIDRVVDEFIFKCTHDRVLDWLLPGVPPTHKRLEVPMLAVVNIRGDRLYHEHINWDHATVLRQLGLLPEYYTPIENGSAVNNEPSRSSANPRGALRLPVAGVEGAQKMRDKNAVPSNEMFQFGIGG